MYSHRSYQNWPSLRPDLRPIIAGVIGGGLSTLFLHPLDMLKTRQAVYGGTIRQTLIRSWKSTAFGGGLYQGVSANILVSATSWGVYFFAYEQIKTLVGTKNAFGAAFAAGVVCNLVTNPLSVMRSRMLLTDPSASSKYSSVAKTFEHIAKSEGLGGFYKVSLESIFLLNFILSSCLLGSGS